jgi:hypothetical protein
LEAAGADLEAGSKESGKSDINAGKEDESEVLISVLSFNIPLD